MTENHTVKKPGQPLKGQDGSEKSQRSLWDVRKTYEMLGGCLSCLTFLLPAKGSPLWLPYDKTLELTIMLPLLCCWHASLDIECLGCRKHNWWRRRNSVQWRKRYKVSCASYLFRLPCSVHMLPGKLHRWSQELQLVICEILCACWMWSKDFFLNTKDENDGSLRLYLKIILLKSL